MLETLPADERRATGGSRLAPWCRISVATPTLVPVAEGPTGYSATAGSQPWAPLFQQPVASASTATRAAHPTRVEVGLEVLATYGLLLSGRAEKVVPSRSPTEMLDLLRLRAGLRVSELVELLGVSRRSFYTWVERDALSHENERRLTGLVHALDPLVNRWSPAQIRLWLSQGDPPRSDLLRRGFFDAVRTDALEGLQEPAINVRQARRIAVSDSFDQTPLEGYDEVTRQAFASTFTRSRRVIGIPQATPREITGMESDTEE